MKPLPPGSYIVRPFKSYKGYSYSYSYLGSNDPVVRIDDAVPPADGWNGISEPYNPNGLGKYSLYKSVDQMFYHTEYFSGLSTSASAFPPEFDREWAPASSSAGVYVVNVAALLYGEQVRPGSFVISTTAGAKAITDDGEGHLSSGDGTIGNIFYPLGIAVVGKVAATGSLITSGGMYLTTGSQLIVNFQSQLTQYEHTVVCTLEKDEFNYSTNPSLQLFTTSSVSGSIKMLDAFSSGTLTPYITEIGLYDSEGEMVAIAKVPRAIKRAPELDQTFIVKLDVL